MPKVTESLAGPIAQLVVDAMPLIKRNGGATSVLYIEDGMSQSVEASTGRLTQRITYKMSKDIQVIERSANPSGPDSSTRIVITANRVESDRGTWDKETDKHIPGPIEAAGFFEEEAIRALANLQIPGLFKAVAQARAEMRRQTPKPPPSPKLPKGPGR